MERCILLQFWMLVGFKTFMTRKTKPKYSIKVSATVSKSKIVLSNLSLFYTFCTSSLLSSLLSYFLSLLFFLLFFSFFSSFFSSLSPFLFSSISYFLFEISFYSLNSFLLFLTLNIQTPKYSTNIFFLGSQSSLSLQALHLAQPCSIFKAVFYSKIFLQLLNNIIFLLYKNHLKVDRNHRSIFI